MNNFREMEISLFYKVYGKKKQLQKVIEIDYGTAVNETSGAKKLILSLLNADKIKNSIADSIENVLKEINGEYLSFVTINYRGDKLVEYNYYSTVKNDGLSEYLAEIVVSRVFMEYTEYYSESLIQLCSDNFRKEIKELI